MGKDNGRCQGQKAGGQSTVKKTEADMLEKVTGNREGDSWKVDCLKLRLWRGYSYTYNKV